MTQPIETFLLTKEERKILLTDRMISKPLQKKLKSVSPSVDEHIFSFSEEELAEVFFIAQERMANSNNDKTIHILTGMLNRLSDRLPAPEGFDPEFMDEEALKETAEFFHSLPDDVKRNITQIVQSGASPDSPDTIKATADIFLRYAMREACGVTDLTSERLLQLMEGNWNTSSSPILLEWKLAPDEIKHIFLLHLAIKMVQFMFENKGRIRLNQEEYIVPQDMKKLLSKLNLPREAMEIIRSLGKNVPEWQVLPVYKVHLALFYSDIFLLSDNDMVLSPMGLKIFEKEQYGRLLAKMFRTFFQKMDLSFLVPDIEGVEVFQDYVPLFLYRLSEGYDQWVTVEDSADQMITKPIMEQMGVVRSESHVILMNCLFIPLMEFGLLELEGDFPGSMKSSIRKTPLFDRFIRFDFPDSDSDSDSNVIPLPLR